MVENLPAGRAMVQACETLRGAEEVNKEYLFMDFQHKNWVL